MYRARQTPILRKEALMRSKVSVLSLVLLLLCAGLVAAQEITATITGTVTDQTGGVLPLVPGVSSSLSDEVGIGLTNLASLSINGARRNGINWLVDGAINVDVGSNITLLSVPTLESIEEFKIITSSYAAEWPRSGGGIINVVTKSGTNVFRGSVYEFFRNDALNANSFFRKQVGCTADGTCSTTPADVATRANPAHLRYHNFGFTLGGPIKKDKLFFFYSQEFRRISRASTATSASVPEAAWLSDPSNANYVAPADRDPNAVSLLSAWPAAN